MVKAAAVSLGVIVVILSIAAVSALYASAQPGADAIAQTGTSIENPNSVAPKAPCIPDEKVCATFVSQAIEKQWQVADAELLRLLNGAPQFTQQDRKTLVENEKGMSAHQRYYLRVAVLRQLIRK